MSRDLKDADASRPRRPQAGAESDPPTALDLEELVGSIIRYLGFQSADPLADADRIRSALDECQAALLRKSDVSSGRREEPTMVKGDLLPESNAAIVTDHPAPSRDLDALLVAVVDDSERWLSTPSAQFGGRHPIELVGTEEEVKIFDLLHAVDQGLF
jgi:Protein of unknown function (DUF2384)